MSGTNSAWLSCGFNSQPPEGGWAFIFAVGFRHGVSTHSRPKAAGCPHRQTVIAHSRFNSQPPEGGWRLCDASPAARKSFNSQPPEGGW